LGVFPVDTFFPEKDRMELAMLLNGLIASPAFSDWIQGQPLDVQGLLYSPSGKPLVSILYIAHLSDAEKQFFLTLLLEQVVGWMRAQSGTTSLRALLYMDEVFGYLPPHPSNPPTKKPMLTLLKQARAFGLGLILATQNPVDLDYKALSNAGTWFIGRMQADRDKQRLLDGLEGVQVSQGGTSRAEFDKMISAVQSRVFLLHNVHEREPVVFHTRWAMSFLRGPMTRPQIQQLVGAQPAPAAAPQPRPGAPPAAPKVEPASDLPYTSVPPQLPSAVQQVFLPSRVSMSSALRELGREHGWSSTQAPREAYLVYEPALLGLAELRFAHTKSRQTHAEDVAYLLLMRSRDLSIDWEGAQVDLTAQDFEREPEQGALFAELPSELGQSKQHTAMKKDFSDHLYYNSSLTLQHHPHLDLYSEIGESAKSFERRCRKAAEEARDAEAEKLTAKYKTKLDRLEDRLRREERELEEDKIDYDARKQEEVLSGLESVVGLFAGRKSSRRLSTASRKRRMTRQAKADMRESEEMIADLEAQIDDLEAEAQLEVDELSQKWGDLIEQVEQIEVRPRRTDVRLSLFALAWLPYWQATVGDRTFTLPASEVEPT
jgi:hypothetical protein